MNGSVVGSDKVTESGRDDEQVCSVTGVDRSSLVRSHCARSAEGEGRGARGAGAPREVRRVSLSTAAGYLQLNQYRLLDPIGQGSYGIVKLAYNEENDTHYAMKIMSKRKLMRRAGQFGREPPRRAGSGGASPPPLHRLHREVATLKKLDHPNVVKLIEVLDDPMEDQVYLVFELLEGGPVLEVPTDSPLSEEQARKDFRDALLGLEYLHFQGISHRDLKPANLLRGGGRVLVADLGSAGGRGARGAGGAGGTPAFQPPEARGNDTYDAMSGDVYSLGVTLWSLVVGRPPWPPRPPFPPPSRLSPPLQDLLTRMTHPDPALRATVQQIKEHEWVVATGPLPSEEENCRLVEVTEEEVERGLTSIPDLATLILIKAMIKNHSFQNPFSRRSGDSGGGGEGAMGGAGRRRAELGRRGRSLSAPSHVSLQRQTSFDVNLEPLSECQDPSLDIVDESRDLELQTPREEPPRVEAPRAEPPRLEAPRVEPLRVEFPSLEIEAPPCPR